MSAIDILLVEDDPRDLELTLRSLRPLANAIHVARDGAEAVEVLQREGPVPRLVLLDLKLPKLSGTEVLRRIRADERLRATPVVIMTSTDDQPEIDTCYQLGANSFVRKPVEFAAFSEAVRQVGMYWLLLNKPPTNGGKANGGKS